MSGPPTSPLPITGSCSSSCSRAVDRRLKRRCTHRCVQRLFYFVKGCRPTVNDIFAGGRQGGTVTRGKKPVSAFAAAQTIPVKAAAAGTQIFCNFPIFAICSRFIQLLDLVWRGVHRYDKKRFHPYMTYCHLTAVRGALCPLLLFTICPPPSGPG